MKANRISCNALAGPQRFRSRIGIWSIGTLVMLLFTTTNASCSPTQNSDGVVEEGAQTFVYECERDGTFVASVSGDSATIFVSEKTIRLPRVRSASGEKFQTDGITYWTKDNEALLDTPDAAFRNCRNNRMRAIWEDARLRGVELRATGNEPGWYLEVSGMSQIVFVTDYGQSRYMFSDAKAPSDPHAQNNVLQAVNGSHRIELILQRSRCMDSMSDQQFDTRVTVRLDDREYRGCGNTLH